MAILEVLTFPNPILKKKSIPVGSVTDELRKLARDMIDTMYDAPGVGLAAPQVGHNIRLIVIDTRPRDEDGQVVEEEMTELEKKIKYPLILFNPEVTKKEGKHNYREGCLSVPGYQEEVTRAQTVVVKALNEKGEAIEFESDGLLGVCVQHEIDHLDGVLFIDRLSPIKSNMIKSKIKKHGYPDDDDRQHTL